MTKPIAFLSLLCLLCQFSMGQAPFITAGDSSVLATNFDGQDAVSCHTCNTDYLVDLDGDAIDDFRVRHAYWNGTSGIFIDHLIECLDSNAFVHSTTDTVFSLDSPPVPMSVVPVVAQLNLGDSIDNSMNWRTNISNTIYSFTHTDGVLRPWNDQGYAAVKVDRGNTTCIGWIETDTLGNVYGFASNCATTTGTVERDPAGWVGVGPNPSSGRVTVRYRPIESGSYEINIRDLNGRLVASREGIASYQNHATFFDLNDQPKGLYLVSVQHGKHQYQTRLVIQ